MANSFLKYIAFEKRFSDHTVKSYQCDLEQFSNYISSNFNTADLNDTTQLMVRSWILSLMDSGVSARTVNRKIASLRAYFKFALKREEVSKSPMEKVKLLKVQKDLPSFADEKQLSIEIDKAEFDDPQDRIIIELLYGTGIRLAELLGLKESSFNWQEGTIKVLGKRNKERVIPLSKPLSIQIKDFIDEKSHVNPSDPDPYLIVNKSGTKAYPMLVYRVVKKFLNGVQSTDKKSPHALRHSFATHLLNKGADLNAVKDLLGHSSLAATQVYTHNTLDKLKSTFDQAHPKA
jgi:integrase/recombinase XerC